MISQTVNRVNGINKGGWNEVTCSVSVCVQNCTSPAVVACMEHQWQCGGDSECIPASWKCDGQADCHNSMDEDKCEPVSLCY